MSLRFAMFILLKNSINSQFKSNQTKHTLIVFTALHFINFPFITLAPYINSLFPRFSCRRVKVPFKETTGLLMNFYNAVASHNK